MSKSLEYIYAVHIIIIFTVLHQCATTNQKLLNTLSIFNFTGRPLKCYTCSSLIDSMCFTNPIEATTCPHSSKGCLKIITAGLKVL